MPLIAFAEQDRKCCPNWSAGPKRSANNALATAPAAASKRRKTSSATGKASTKTPPAKKGGGLRASRAPDRSQHAITSFFAASPPASPGPKQTTLAGGRSACNGLGSQAPSSLATKQVRILLMRRPPPAFAEFVACSVSHSLTHGCYTYQSMKLAVSSQVCFHVYTAGHVHGKPPHWHATTRRSAVSVSRWCCC